MGVDQLNTEIILPKEHVDNTKLDIDWVKLQIETQTAAKALRDEILNDTDRKLTHEQIVVALKQYENQGWPQVIDDNSAAYVISLQLALKAAGYDPGKIDALYGKSTTEAVKAFQKAVGLKEDGSAGPYTIAKLIEKLGGDPKELTPDARPVSIPAEAAPAAPVASEVVSEKPKDLVEALKKQPLTAFDKKWLKENLGVEDITKIPAWKEGCNGVAYEYDGGILRIANYSHGNKNGSALERWFDGVNFRGNYSNGNRDGKSFHKYGDNEMFEGEYIMGRFYFPNDKKPLKNFSLEQLNNVNMKQIWEKYIAPEYTSNQQKEWLKKKGADKGVTVLVNDSGDIIINNQNSTINLIAISNIKVVGADKKIDLVKFVAVIKKELGNTINADNKAEMINTAKNLLEKSLEDKWIPFDKLFTNADRKDPIRAQQIQKLQSYFSDENKLWLDDTSIITKNNKIYIQLDLDNAGNDKTWTKGIQIPYEMGFANGKYQPGIFQPALRKYIIEELFSKKDHTDIFTKIKDQNIKLDL